MAHVAEIALADARDGELFGYALGQVFLEPDDGSHDAGRVKLVAAAKPVKPDAIEAVYVLVTPVTRTIGRIAGETWYASGEDAIVAYERFREILRARYADWQAEEQTDLHFHMTRLHSADYVLGIQVSGPHRDALAGEGDRPFQLVLSLSYDDTSQAGSEFDLLASDEMKQALAEKISEDDLRGL